MKKSYREMTLTLVSMELSSAVLTASVTNHPIDVATVTVKEYENGFGDEPFKEINFD